MRLSKEDDFGILGAILLILFLLSFAIFSRSVSTALRIILVVIAVALLAFGIKILEKLKKHAGYNR